MPPTDKALLRYQAISAYLALDPPRGRRRQVLEQLARKTWPLPDGRTVSFAADTLKTWVRRYRRGGLGALEDAPRPQPGVQVLDAEQVATLVRLKQEVPARSLDRIIRIAEETGLVPKGVVRRSTLHRVLRAHGVSGRPTSASTTTDLDRFEAAAPNDLWQSDMLAGPWLPDPRRPGKHRRAWLYAFLDDHSRCLLAGRFAFKGSLPALELVFREAMRRHGVPRRVYYDNGAVYRRHHMRLVVGHLGIHAMIFTQPYRPEGHGKIEAFNRLCTSAFIAEVKASAVTTLDELNAAFRAWVDLEYNQRVHGETNEAPLPRWRAGAHAVTHSDEAKLRAAFLWSTERKADRTGILSVDGTRFQVGAAVAGKKVEVRYDPERMHEEVEIWLDDAFCERVQPFEVSEHRRPKASPPVDDSAAEAIPRPAPTVDWLGHLVGQHTDRRLTPDEALAQATAARREADAAVLARVEAAVSPDVFDPEVVRAWLYRRGPFDPDAFGDMVDFVVEHTGPDRHLPTLLEAARQALGGA